jgi:simple sugar transport system ATP-binding protein
VHSGEVVGIAGVEGNGQEEILEVILGLQSQTSGRVLLNSVELQHLDTRHRRDAGIGYIPADRQRDGLMLSAALWENSALGHQREEPASDGMWINRSALRDHTRKIIEKFDVRTPGVEVSAQALSGGNQQKLIVGREMFSAPTVLVAAHPTRGIDVGAQAAVWESLREAKRQGKGLLLVSADLDELIGLSDRLLVMLRGSIVAALDPQVISAAELGAYMTGVRVQETV